MSILSKEHNAALRGLRWELGAACIIGLVALTLVAGAWGTRRWLVGASSYLVCVAYWCVCHIELHRGGESLHSTLGLGFWVTWMRALGVAFIAGGVCDADMLTELGHIFAWVYGFVVCGDALDGIGARHSQTVSEMGARFDNHVDGLGMFVASVAAVLLGSLPGYYLLLSLAYFGFHLGLWWRQRRGMTVFRDRIMLSHHNRYFAGVHMCLLAVALSPSVQGWTLAVVATIGECLLLGYFLRDWLHVRGAVNPGVGRFNQAWTQAASFSVIQGSLLARASIGLSLVAGMLSVLPAWLWVVPIAVATGLFARTFAWAGLVAFTMGMAPLDFDAAIVLIPSLSWVAWLGSGPFSLARLDDGLYFRTISWRAE